MIWKQIKWVQIRENVKFIFYFLKLLQPVEKSRKRLKKTYEVKFCFMQKEIIYIRLKKMLPIKTLKIVPGLSVATWGVNRFCEKSCVITQ